jgi:CrcB protein
MEPTLGTTGREEPVFADRIPARWSPHLVAALIFTGGCLGAIARAGLAQALPPAAGWPWATFIVNVAGVAILAYFATRLRERQRPSTYRRRFVETGLCGSLTTFSALPIEAIRLSRDGNTALAVLYLGSTVVAGLVLMAAVTRLARRLRRP